MRRNFYTSAADAAAAADVKLQVLKDMTMMSSTGVNNVIKEQKITDLIIGLEDEKGFSSLCITFTMVICRMMMNVLVYHAVQPLSTIKKYAVMIPENAHQEAGFFHALLRVWNIARNSGATVVFYAPENIIDILQKIIKKPI